LGGESQDVPQFQITPEQKNAADYFSAHTAGFYFLANQIALLELSRVRATVQPADVCDATPAGNEAPVSISHWQCRRELYLKQRSETAQGPQIGAPQIVAWSDPNDLLSWNVPQIGGVKVVNISVGNSGFKIPPFIVWPTGAHGNYADNKKVLRLIFKPSEH
jgi:hypothetical protein